MHLHACNWRAMKFYKPICLLVLLGIPVYATIFSTVRGIVHDPSHRPVPGAEVVLRAQNSDYSRKATTNPEGAFEFPAVPAGEYLVRVTHPGFAEQQQVLATVSSSAPVIHFQLQLAHQKES